MNKKRVLFLSPHTDDVELGAGATMKKYLDENRHVHWVVFSTAEESVPRGFDKDTLKNEFLSVTKKLNLKQSQFTIADFKVRRFNEKRQEILELLVEIRNSFKPDLVIGPSLNDFHQDHIVIANEMIRAFKSTSSILSYDLPWNNTNFNTQYFEKISSEQLDFKNKLLECYKSQKLLKRSYFSENFINGIASVRGVQISSDFAESFELVRWIN